MKQTGQVIIFVLLGLVIAGFIGVIFFALNQTSQFQPQNSEISSEAPKPSPTPAPTATSVGETANWKTYTNKNLDLSLRYPSSWDFGESKDTSGSIIHDVFWLRPISEEDKKNHSGITLRYYENPKKLTIPEFSKAYNISNCLIYQGNEVIVTSKKGYKAYFTKEGFCEPLPAKIYTWEYADRIFQMINFRWFNVKEDPLLEEMFKTIIFSQ